MNLVVLLAFLGLNFGRSNPQEVRKSVSDSICSSFLSFACINCNDVETKWIRAACDWTAGRDHKCHEVCKISDFNV